jgi:hypothetical protein
VHTPLGYRGAALIHLGKPSGLMSIVESVANRYGRYAPKQWTLPLEPQKEQDVAASLFNQL